MSQKAIKISVIIPVYNEEKKIYNLVANIKKAANAHVAEVLVSDGQSNDNTRSEALRAGAKVILSPKKGRAYQMNLAAQQATGEFLYFLHADVENHKNFCYHIQNTLSNGVDLACYRYRFDSKKHLLRINSFLTRFHTIWSGGGDQSLMIRKQIFERCHGFKDDMIIMEDFEFVERAKKQGFTFKIIPYEIKVSARKYDKNSWIRVQIVNLLTIIAWKIGVPQDKLHLFYQRSLNW
ncbi:MAG: TIGR04283 family arsenosugar biosynthesis glycosyltransferase [Saprospiraceae bacterium]